MDNKYEENEFYSEIFNYISEVFVGIETKLFKSCEEKKELLQKLNCPEGMLLGSNALETYLNTVYRGLIDKKDNFVLDQFKGFDKYTPINSVLLLNMISVSAMNIYQKMNRSKLDIGGDLENYINSVRTNIGIMKKYYIYLFDKDYKMCKDVKPVNSEVD